MHQGQGQSLPNGVSGIANNHDSGVQPAWAPPGLPHASPQQVVQTQGSASDQSSSGLATPGTTPPTPVQGDCCSQRPKQNPPLSIPQGDPSTTAQSDAYATQIGADGRVLNGVPLQSEQVGFTNAPNFHGFAPSFFQFPVHGNQQPLGEAPYPPSQYPSLYDLQTKTVSRPIDAPPKAIKTTEQRTQVVGELYPHPSHQHAANGMIGLEAPSAEATSMNHEMRAAQHNCACGPGCQCVYCAIHPNNSATTERLQELAQIISESDNEYLPLSGASQPQSSQGESFAATEAQEMIPQAYHPHIKGPSMSSTDAPVNQESTLQPGFGDGPFFMDDDATFQEAPPLSTGPSPYYTMQYAINSNCTDATGTCMCGSDCTCYGCLTHSGHSGPSGLPV